MAKDERRFISRTTTTDRYKHNEDDVSVRFQSVDRVHWRCVDRRRVFVHPEGRLPVRRRSTAKALRLDRDEFVFGRREIKFDVSSLVHEFLRVPTKEHSEQKRREER